MSLTARQKHLLAALYECQTSPQTNNDGKGVAIADLMARIQNDGYTGADNFGEVSNTFADILKTGGIVLVQISDGGVEHRTIDGW